MVVGGWVEIMVVGCLGDRDYGGGWVGRDYDGGWVIEIMVVGGWVEIMVVAG